MHITENDIKSSGNNGRLLLRIPIKNCSECKGEGTIPTKVKDRDDPPCPVCKGFGGILTEEITFDSQIFLKIKSELTIQIDRT